MQNIYLTQPPLRRPSGESDTSLPTLHPPRGPALFRQLPLYSRNEYVCSSRWQKPTESNTMRNALNIFHKY